ncbi:hypothetical protein BDN70DRAFT_938193 [Pholiota conissans]|uniref:Uncharacterized protein n=1 Tax=Pholiota conissans TaxID=109636 RepID=A0A9P6CN38_9AGAR|nr:hypothetical protein BDN70DRAFT_938193 [Pholiota conissans]
MAFILGDTPATYLAIDGLAQPCLSVHERSVTYSTSGNIRTENMSFAVVEDSPADVLMDVLWFVERGNICGSVRGSHRHGPCASFIHPILLFNIRWASRAPTVIPRSSAITRLDLNIASAERLFYRYLSPAGNTVNSPENHEFYLPPTLRIHSFPLSSSQEPKSQTELALMAQIPDIFHAQELPLPALEGVWQFDANIRSRASHPRPPYSLDRIRGGVRPCVP